jgi:hypothetical protein
MEYVSLQRLLLCLKTNINTNKHTALSHRNNHLHSFILPHADLKEPGLEGGIHIKRWDVCRQKPRNGSSWMPWVCKN